MANYKKPLGRLETKSTYKKPLDKVEANKPTRYYSSKQEKAVASAVGGRKTPNSGATPNVKGDVLTQKWLMECKSCTKKQLSFTMQKEWFDKNKQESNFMNKDYSAVVFNFGPNEPNIYCIDEILFKRMMYALELLDQQEENE